LEMEMNEKLESPRLFGVPSVNVKLIRESYIRDYQSLFFSRTCICLKFDNTGTPKKDRPPRYTFARLCRVLLVLGMTLDEISDHFPLFLG